MGSFQTECFTDAVDNSHQNHHQTRDEPYTPNRAV